MVKMSLEGEDFEFESVFNEALDLFERSNIVTNSELMREFYPKEQWEEFYQQQQEQEFYQQQQEQEFQHHQEQEIEIYPHQQEQEFYSQNELEHEVIDSRLSGSNQNQKSNVMMMQPVLNRRKLIVRKRKPKVCKRNASTKMVCKTSKRVPFVVSWEDKDTGHFKMRFGTTK